ncbi:hypothetical protein I545_2447 [Mycobacterium kansasii 662]|uniref:Uncharacterized protein n=2 Tax=Mycobacterium kansasii TaxID=1768 RepID=A0A1V3XMR0_MYCKA|nr:hypothetical protein I547_4336 [Mycobacterium kansasii 824]EUA19645.1 hypothetical protein I545_2447 [Mycobacterium kansasii 662]KEP40382.1 hypothetical protein MKSMC1_44980 [Mycobacterium kansasii]OOK80485.1 hypothetical protein BZL29_1744 [Mycobacterium kansasii]
MPTHYQRKMRGRMGDGHADILPWPAAGRATRSDLFSP